MGLGLSATQAQGQATDGAISAARPALKIGYLEVGSDLTPARTLVQGLKEFLLADPGMIRALDEEGYSSREISLRPCDGPEDMIQRLGVGEFELAFATSVIYARQFAPSGQGPGRGSGAGYEPILQFERRGDIVDPRGNGVMRDGVIFIGRGSRLWGTTPSEAEIGKAIAADRMAVSSYYSAASYVYPLKAIADRFGQIRPKEIRFCGSSADVVRHVITGLINVGACERRILETVGRVQTAEGSMPLYQILFATDPLPTDPVLLRRDLLPSDPGNSVGRELKVAIRSFFNTRTPRPAPGLSVQKANRRSYEAMAEFLEFFDAINRPVEPRTEVAEPPTDQGPSAPATPASPTATPAPRAVLPPPADELGERP